MQCVIWQQKMYSYRREKIGASQSQGAQTALTHNNKFIIIIVIVIQMSVAGEGFPVCTQEIDIQCDCLQTHT
jgi:hypothetical protein